MDSAVESFTQRLQHYPELQEKLVLHRGWHRLEHEDESRPVENTRDAYLKASSMDVKFAECDIYATLDDELVLLHNPTAKAHIKEDERSELADVPVSEQTFTQIQKLRLEDGSSIPLVQDVLQDLLASKQTKLVVELKCNRSGPLFAKLLHNSRHLIPAVGLVFSFLPQAIVSFAHEFESSNDIPRLPLAWLTEASYYNCATMRFPHMVQDENNYPLKYCESITLSEFLEKLK
jgi:glycerophosphoryl diester phosphodiesterase